MFSHDCNAEEFLLFVSELEACLLHAVTQGDQGFVERINRVEFIHCGKIIVKFSWLFFAKTLQSLCDPENSELFGVFSSL